MPLYKSPSSSINLTILPLLMVRDMDMVRDILIAAERGVQVSRHHDPELLAYHVREMDRAGLVIAATGKNSNAIYGITWEGWNLLDTIRNEEVWKKAKNALLKEGASWTFGLLRAWVTDYLAKQLGIGGSPGSA